MWSVDHCLWHVNIRALPARCPVVLQQPLRAITAHWQPLERHTVVLAAMELEAHHGTGSHGEAHHGTGSHGERLTAHGQPWRGLPHIGISPDKEGGSGRSTESLLSVCSFTPAITIKCEYYNCG